MRGGSDDHHPPDPSLAACRQPLLVSLGHAIANVERRGDRGERLAAVVSATGRGPRQGGPDDFYRTPAWAVHRLLDAIGSELAYGRWVDCGAGDGAIIKAVNSQWDPSLVLAESDEARQLVGGIDWLAIECRATARAELEATGARVEIADFLAGGAVVDHEAAVSIMNPPFHSAYAFVSESMRRFPNAVTIALLRLPWIASAKRAVFLREHQPSVYVLPNRPSFTHDGKTDATDYGWFVFDGAGSLRVLEPTPKGERVRR